MGVVAYRLELPPEASIHDVFHVSQLKKAVGEVENIHPRVPSLGDDFERKLVTEAVTGMRWNPNL